MAINKSIWRFQCDPGFDPDPLVDVFIQEVTTVEGRVFVKEHTTPVTMKFSEMIGLTLTKLTEKAIALETAMLRRPPIVQSIPLGADLPPVTDEEIVQAAYPNEGCA